MIYRLLLLAFPAAIRRQFGADMQRMFDDQRRMARAEGTLAVVRLWFDAVTDALLHGGAARLAGGGTQCRNFAREIRRWRWWMHAFRQDLVYAMRLLARQPGVTFIAILTLALGIGANTAIFSAVNALLLRPLPYADPDRLVMVWEKRQAEGVLDNPVSPADFLDWRKMNGAFENIAAMTAATAVLTNAGEPVRLWDGAVTPGFFEVLGVQPMLGRTFRPEEGLFGQHRVAILGHRLWQDRFSADASVVGRKITLNSVPYEVVGVLPASFEFSDREIEMWSPLPLEGGPQPPPRSNHYLSVYARLKPEVTLARARAEMERVGSALQQQYPDANRNHSAYVSLLRDELHEPLQSGLLVLFGAVAFVLLIACVNVANLLLAKAASRRREMAVRAALGAGRLRLAGQAMTESVLLALCGGAAGLLVARWGIDSSASWRRTACPCWGPTRSASTGACSRSPCCSPSLRGLSSDFCRRGISPARTSTSR